MKPLFHKQTKALERVLFLCPFTCFEAPFKEREIVHGLKLREVMSEEIMNAMSGEEVQQDSPETAVETG